jgi:hypothetical protein
MQLKNQQHRAGWGVIEENLVLEMEWSGRREKQR